MGPSSPWTETAFSEMAHGTACAASASATGKPSAHRSSSPDSSRGNGGHRRSGCRVFEGGVGEGKEGLPETSPRYRGRRVPEIHRQVREANCRVDRERESEQSALTNAKARLQRLETEQSVPVEEAPAPADWKAQMEALQAQVNSLREERDQAVHSPAVKRQAARSFTCQWGHSTNAHSGSCRVGQLDAGSSSGAPECDELERQTLCGGSQHETGRRCFTDGLLDRWNGDVKAVPSVAEAIRHQCGLKGVRVGEADNPGPSRRRGTQRLRAVPWVWDSDSEWEDDHRNFVPRRVDPFVPPDVVEALE